MVLLWLVILKRVVVRLLMVPVVVLGLVVILTGQVAEGKLPQRFGVMGRQHQAEVIDAGRCWWSGWQSLRHLAMHVATEDERDGLGSRMPFPVHVHMLRHSTGYALAARGMPCCVRTAAAHKRTIQSLVMEVS